MRTLTRWILVGTENRVCEAIGEVRVEFLGQYRDRPKAEDFTLRNRCGSDGLLDVDNLSMLLAARIHYALTTFRGTSGRFRTWPPRSVAIPAAAGHIARIARSPTGRCAPS